MGVKKFKTTNWTEFLEEQSRPKQGRYYSLLLQVEDCAKGICNIVSGISGMEAYTVYDDMYIEFIFDESNVIINKLKTDILKDKDTTWLMLLKLAVKNQKMYLEKKNQKKY